MYLAIFALPSASVSFRQLPWLSSLSDSPPRGIIHLEEGNYLLRPVWGFCAKTQFLGVFSPFCASVSFRQLPSASVSFRQLPSASVACFLVEFASTWNHPCGRCELVTDLCTVFPRSATDAVSYASLQFQPPDTIRGVRNPTSICDLYELYTGSCVRRYKCSPRGEPQGGPRGGLWTMGTSAPRFLTQAM